MHFVFPHCAKRIVTSTDFVTAVGRRLTVKVVLSGLPDYGTKLHAPVLQIALPLIPRQLVVDGSPDFQRITVF